jgi:hypothetical protein
LQGVPHVFSDLFGVRLFDSLDWYFSVCTGALPPSAEALFVTVADGARPLALLPMRRDVTRISSLTTACTGLWRPLTAPGLTATELHGVGYAFGRWSRNWAKLRLEALDLQDPTWSVFIDGLRDAGIRALPFDHFGSWTAFTGLGWDAYFASRPASLRAAVESQGARLQAEGAALRVVTGGAELQPAIEALAPVLAATGLAGLPISFASTLLRACAAEGWLRLGLLEQDGSISAGQAWVVQGGGGTLLYSTEETTAPGSVLTAWMVRWLLERNGVATLDFGRGDGEFQLAWASLRRQREGLVLANPWRPAGLAAVLRRRLGAKADNRSAAQTRFHRRHTD